MAKTHKQLKAERRRRLEERRQILLEFPEVYQRDFDKALKRYLQREFPEVDSHDCDVNLVPVWDPDGDEPPEPFDENPARIIVLSTCRHTRCLGDLSWWRST